jgi:cytochrome o ubiquinol oxidase subunit I
VAFTPLYVLGLMGVTRRMRVFDDPSLQIWFLIAALGAGLIACGIAALLVQIAVSVWKRDELRDTTGDPWDGRTLEWATSSPPPAWNFAILPQVAGRDAFWAWKQQRRLRQDAPTEPLKYEPIEVPTNTPTGFIIAFFAVTFGFAMIWHIWWMAGVGLLGIFATMLAFAFRQEEEIEIPADELARFDHDHPAHQHHQAEVAA